VLNTRVSCKPIGSVYVVNHGLFTAIPHSTYSAPDLHEFHRCPVCHGWESGTMIKRRNVNGNSGVSDHDEFKESDPND